ncbi:NUDIX domain-containing protein [Cryobacterium sp. PH31-AA6]|uniref:NUDIX hydrolase n=1 Tax=Cryobacterium sp. PH31-AA6 TaxID=3046205 RepID=UPI0024B88F2F|nr:NUDIX domain-containing protein [Cryobacterium sp. PH31-AA6]MDJ0325070.1 NUDIX domain-containing protein [Cryobacterium sp. PH31-AA6]
MPQTPANSPSPATDFVNALEAWTPRSVRHQTLRAEYRDLVAGSPRTALDRNGGPEHLTASCFVFSPDLTRVLLCFHRKGRFWVQLGGHIEAADDSVASAAFREAREECGIDELSPLSGGAIVDLDRHSLGGGFGRCGVHWDVGFAAVVAPDAVPAVSDESDDVAWWPIVALPATVPPDFALRLHGVLDELARVAGQAARTGTRGHPSA